MVDTALDETSARRRLTELQSTYGPPAARALQETFLQRVKVGTLELFMVGLVAHTPEGAAVTGAAADDRGFPIDRAYFELLERLAIFAARVRSEPFVVRDRSGRAKGSLSQARLFPADAKPECLRTSLSNGVALHATWPLACEAALCELIERDRVLRSFAGEFVPVSVPDASPKLTRALRKHYVVETYTFGPKRAKLTHVVSGLFMFPRQLSLPLVCGFGCGADLAHAASSAQREALQRLAFLWGEALPDCPPPPAASPDYHQEYYLYPPHHALLRRWLDGKQRRARAKSQATRTPLLDQEPVRFVDLTTPELSGALWVARAVSRRAAALRFGRARSSDERAPHPIS